MKRLAVLILSVILAIPASAQFRDRNPRPEFIWDAGFEYDFDNREFDTGGNAFSHSMTINAARLSPSAGILLRDGKCLSHRLMLGVDIMKDFGDNPVGDGDGSLENTDLFREITFSYSIRYADRRNIFEGRAGIFPRSLAKGEYGDEFISDSLRFYDNNIEGLLLQWRRPRSYYEVGFDWPGKIGHLRRERFMVFSYGNTDITSWLSAGWAANIYHFANTAEYRGVVDNILAEPFVRIHVPISWLQKADVTTAFVTGYQNDRIHSDDVMIPRGGMLTVSAMKWNIGIDNRFYYGTSLMPLYDDIDDGGNKYGSLLYYGSPFYRVHKSGAWDRGGAADRLEIYYTKNISGILGVRLSAYLHFADGGDGFAFQGWRQRISLLFDLNGITEKNGDTSRHARSRRM